MFRYEKSNRKEYLKSWGRFILLLTVAILTKVNEVSESKEKQIQLKEKNYTDSLRAAQYIDSLKKFSTAHSDSLKVFSKRNSDSIKVFSSSIVKSLAEYHLKYDSSTNKIKKAIDTARNKQEPSITYALGDEPIKHRQSHDTFYIYPAIYNAGQSVAKRINYKAYFISLKNGVFHEYFEPIFILNSTELGSGLTTTVSNGSKCYISNFNFDKKNSMQFLLILGSYSNEDGKTKPISICYKWNSVDLKWGISTDEENIGKLHYNIKEVRYFHFDSDF